MNRLSSLMGEIGYSLAQNRKVVVMTTAVKKDGELVIFKEPILVVIEEINEDGDLVGHSATTNEEVICPVSHCFLPNLGQTAALHQVGLLNPRT